MADQRITGRDAPRTFLDTVDEGIKQKGYEFASSFFALWKSLKMYGEQNEAVKKAVDKTLDVLHSFFKTQPTINFGYNGTDIVINDQRLKGKRGGEDYLDMLARLFTSLYVGEIEISSTVTQQDLVLFCQLTRNVSLDQPGTEDTFRRIEAEISGRIASMHVSMYDPIEDELPPIIDKPQMARQVYRNLVTECPLFRKKALQKQPLPLKKATRSIQNLVDLLTDDEEDRQWSHLLFLASLDSY
ncbi:MAG TPA: hypothetical protein PKH10_09635, partial [bacterium]|nr:hypothetical protein [bacterium]